MVRDVDINLQKFIMEMVSNGCTSKQIGLKIDLSSRTIEAYLMWMRGYYEAVNTPHLVAIFFRTKLID